MCTNSNFLFILGPFERVLDLNCEVGSSAVAAIKRRVAWYGVEPHEDYRYAIPRFVAETLAPLAVKLDYFTDLVAGVLGGGVGGSGKGGLVVWIGALIEMVTCYAKLQTKKFYCII